MVFEGTVPALELLLSRACSLAVPPVTDHGNRQQSVPPQAWQRLAADSIKINFDAAWAKTGAAASYGCVARNDEGEVLAAATKPTMRGL